MSEQKVEKKPKPAREPKAKPAAKDAGAPKPAARASVRPAGPARLHAFYRDAVVKDLTQKFGYKSVMQVPRIDKIVLNMGVGEAVADKKIMDNAVADMTKIAGQK